MEDIVSHSSPAPVQHCQDTTPFWGIEVLPKYVNQHWNQIIRHSWLKQVFFTKPRVFFKERNFDLFHLLKMPGSQRKQCRITWNHWPVSSETLFCLETKVFSANTNPRLSKPPNWLAFLLLLSLIHTHTLTTTPESSTDGHLPLCLFFLLVPGMLLSLVRSHLYHRRALPITVQTVYCSVHSNCYGTMGGSMNGFIRRFRFPLTA